MTKVFITNSAGHDFTKATKFGQIEWVTKGNISFQSLDRLKYSITERLLDSNKEDYLLLSGTQVVCVISAVIWFILHGKVKLLVYDKKDNGNYKEMTISTENVTDLLRLIKWPVQAEGSLKDELI